MITNKLYFDPKEWRLNPDCPNNVSERSYITGIDGKLTQVYTLGDWSYNWTEIVREVELTENEEYVFTFWLNGGENDLNSEICQFRVRGEGCDSDVVYKLNRSFIPYKKHIGGWYLYEIPFVAEKSRMILKFVAKSAYMSVMPALDASEYDGIVDDYIPKGKPQRHNIVFQDGWPQDKWYSGNHDSVKKQSDNKNGNRNSFNFDFNGFSNGFSNDISGQVRGMIQGRIYEIADEIADEVEDELRDEMESIKDEILDELRESLKESLKSSLMSEE